MENQRLFLFLALGFVSVMMWSAWQRDYNVQEPTAVADSPAAAPEAAPGGADQPLETPAVGGLPSGERVHVVTDLLDVEISAIGGDIRNVALRQYSVSVKNQQPFLLMADNRDPVFVAQSGLMAAEGVSPNHQVTFKPQAQEYRLQEGADSVVVPLVWTSESGVRVIKRYTFNRNSYTVNVEHVVENASGEPWSGYQYMQLRRSPDADTGNMFMARSYTGGVIYSEDGGYEKLSFDDMADADFSRTVTDGWAAMIQHYFLGAWIPPRDQPLRFYTRALANSQYVLGMSSPQKTVAPGSSDVFASQFYVGPKEQDRLAAVAPKLDLTVDYGFLTIISKPLFWLLDAIHSLIGNWGWAIVLLTLLIKLAFYKLSETSYRSMAKMRKLQPKMQQLKERFGDDRQRMNQELMELYKKEKINPLGGCLPILVQIPVFIALYWALLESVELRQAPFILWINDLSVPDPFYVLPIIMGISMLAQQKLNPAPLDPIQQKIMMALPIVFTVFFLFFPAGLVLYWVVNNTLSIAQQWVITRRIESEPGRADPKKA